MTVLIEPIAYQALASAITRVVAKASAAIMQIYSAAGHESEGGVLPSIDVSFKADESPVTEADIAAHQLLLEGLALLLPGTPILSEEGAIADFSERKHWQRYWLIDPLDGTKEFIQRNGEFTVNVALIEKGRPVLGVISVPLTGVTYWGAKGCGAHKMVAGEGSIEGPMVSESINSSSLSTASSRLLRVVSSRQYGSATMRAIEPLLQESFDAIEYQGVGSSLKFCLVAEGRADFYPRLAPTSEWDTAAAQAIVEAAGGRVLDLNLIPLRYNTKESLLNPYFYVVGDAQYDWKGILSQIVAE